MPQFVSQDDFEKAMMNQSSRSGIDDGIQRDVGDDSVNVTVDSKMPTQRIRKDVKLSRFQVTRKEYSTSGKFDANITISNNKIQFNAACIKFYPNTNYVQILIDVEGLRMAIRPCGEFDKNAFQWARNQKKDNKRVSREITMADAWSLFFKTMEWNPANKFKVLGTRRIYDNADFVIFFLDDAVEYTTERELGPDGKMKYKRNAFLPVQWRDNFGDYVDVHDKKMEMSTSDVMTLFNTPDGTAHLLNPKKAK